ncbi:MAG: DUF2207 family protein [Bacilli bacterium]
MFKKCKYFLLLLMVLIPFKVNADHIYGVKMEVFINKEGNASIKETWKVKADSGSEWYKQILNLGESKLTNFKVSMDNKELTYKSNWNVNGSIEEKAGYYGINYISNGLELCFGKKDMKSHTFILTYDISNYIFNTKDAQVLYFTLFPKFTADSFDVTVKSYYDFPDNLDVWGYGYKGYAYVKDGAILMSNEGSLDDEYVVLLAKFPLNTFSTNYQVENFNNFEEILGDAKEGSFHYDYDDYNDYNNNYNYKPSLFARIIPYIVIIFQLIVFGGMVTLIYKTISSSKYGFKNNKTISYKDAMMFREIPCNKDIYYANTLININHFGGYETTNIFGAIILKWVKNDKIKFRKEKKGLLKKEVSIIDLTMNPTFDNENEKKLFNMMYEASNDGYLESNELEKWARRNYSKFLDIFNKISNDYLNKLKSEGHIYKRTNKEECKYKNVMDDTIYEETKKLYGLKKFLIEFSQMNTKEVLEVKLWDEYLMFAYLFGIASKVAKQLKNMYPEVIEQMGNGLDYDILIFINNMSITSASAASSARRDAESYSSGGGGFSSGGGGGGSFGGGGGGSMGGR